MTLSHATRTLFGLCAFLILQQCIALTTEAMMKQFWEQRGHKRVPIPENTNTDTQQRVTRSLSNENPWQYTDYTIPPMTLNEQSVANSILRYIATNRHGAGFIYDQNSRTFQNSLPQVVDMAKYLADLLKIYSSNDTDYAQEVQIGQYFACDLDWAQPDPASDYGLIFGSDQDWCATEVDILWASGPDTSTIQSEFDYYNLMSIGDHAKKQIDVACSLEAPTTFHCVIVLARLEQALTEVCELCCDPEACAKKRR